MPLLIPSHRWEFQPPPGLDLNRDHPLAAGLVGAWPANEGSGGILADVAFSNNGAFQGTSPTAPSWATASLPVGGYAVNYPGNTAAFVKLPDLRAQFGQQFTIAAWVQFSAFGSALRVFSARADATGHGFELYDVNAGGVIDLTAYNGTSQVTAAGPVAATTGTICHVVGTCDGINLTCYLNGVAGTPVALGGTLSFAAASAGWAIGRRADAVAGALNGLTGPVYLWNRALASSEIAQLYRNPYPFFLPPPTLRYFPLPSGTSKSDSDSATSSASTALAVSGSDTDSGSLSSTAAVANAGADTDSASLTEAASLAVVLSDTGSAVVSEVAAWSAAVNFRATSTFVTDGAGQTYSLGEAYPTTRSGLTFGWDANDASLARDTSSTVDPRFAGSVSASLSSPGGVQRTFRIDLPAPGTYDVRLAVGSSNGPWPEHHVKIADNATTLTSFDHSNTANLHYLDANGTDWSNLAWPASNQAARLTFTSTVLKVTIGSLSSTAQDTRLAHLALTRVNSPLIALSDSDSASLTESASAVVITPRSDSDSAGLAESSAVAPTEFAAAINFRQTANYVVDGDGQTYSLGEAYPTARAGFSFGWGAGDGVQARNETTSNDPRLCGIMSASATGGVQRTFLLDLPTPGVYAVRLALGDPLAGWGEVNAVVKDGSTPLLTIAAGSTSTNTFFDAGYHSGDAPWSATDWLTSNRAVRLTFASTTFRLTIGSLSSSESDTPLAHLSVAHIPDVGSPVSGSDSASLSDAPSLLASWSDADPASLAGTASLTANVADSGSAALTEAATLFTGNTFQASDPATLGESFALGLAYSEAATLGDSQAIDGAYADADSAGMVDSESLDPDVSDNETWFLYDVAQVQPQGITYAAVNDGSIVLDAVARLRATNVFSWVSAYETEADRVRSADRNPVATVSLVNWDEMDDVDPIQIQRKIVLNIQVVARAKREEDRMKLLSRVSNTVSNTLNGQSLANITFPDQTLCTRGRYRRKGVETILDITLNSAYLIDGFSTRDTAPFVVSYYVPGSNLGAGSTADRDSATLFESIMLVASNEGALAISAADIASFAESSILSITTFGAIEVGVADSGTLAESSSLTITASNVSVSAADTGTLAEATALDISGSGSIAVAVADAFALAESTSLVVIPAGVVPVVVADTGSLAEASSLAIATVGPIAVAVADACTLSESTSLNITTTGEPAMLVLIGDSLSHLAMDGTSQVGNPLILPAAATLQGVTFSCAPNASASPGDQWTASVLRAPASGTGITQIAAVNFNLAPIVADPPLSLNIPIPGGSFALASGDQILCAVAPVGSPSDLIGPGFTVNLIWA